MKWWLGDTIEELDTPKAFALAGRCEGEIKSRAECGWTCSRSVQTAPKIGPLTRDVASMDLDSINGHH